MYFRSNKKHLNNVSLNDSIGYDKDGNEINLIDVLKCESEDTLDKIDTQNKIDLLLKYLDTLSPREKDIIIKRYGLFNTKDMTQKEIAKKWISAVVMYLDSKKSHNKNTSWIYKK